MLGPAVAGRLQAAHGQPTPAEAPARPDLRPSRSGADRHRDAEADHRDVAIRPLREPAPLVALSLLIQDDADPLAEHFVTAITGP
jgi:hypothetical protein